ncbi:MAG: hypothetical protein ABIJ26_01540 [Candidatus Margulisiibacteriota bacterium]|nr:hypothetical protein [Candidatus Margulisiibacteriota bacterium]
MGIPSSISEHIYKSEDSFPAPSERLKLNKAIDTTRRFISQHSDRLDIIEEKFVLADLYVGRGEPGDYEAAKNLYHDILDRGGNPYLRARTLIGLAELSVPYRNETTAAIELCERAGKLLQKLDREVHNFPTFSFFRSKAYVIEADLRITRDEKGDHQKALKLHEKIIKDKKAHWYFKGRALLGKAELILYHYRKKLNEGINLARKAHTLLKGRPGDYFTIKSRIVEAECRVQHGTRRDFEIAERLLIEVVKSPYVYTDLMARAKLDLAEIQEIPKAQQMLKEVQEMEGLDPYIAQKVKLLETKLSEMR